MSFFVDLTYEGSRSIIGPYLATLGAGALAIATVTGFGELAGYALRLFSGRAADKTKRYWPIGSTSQLPRWVGAGFADFPIIAFHWHKAGTVPTTLVPIFYATAMAMSGAGSLLFGRLFDRAGMAILVPLTIGSAAFAPLVFLGGFWAALVGVSLWGIGMGVSESIIPAPVAPMVSPQRRASAYGLFTGAYGVAWFLGSVAIGALFSVSLGAVVAFCVTAELLAPGDPQGGAPEDGNLLVGSDSCSTRAGGAFVPPHSQAGDAFYGQQAAFHRRASAIAADLPACGRDPVAGHDDGNGVRAVGLADRSGGPRPTDHRGELPVGDGGAVGDGPQGTPHLLLERRAVELEGNVERAATAGKVLLELCSCGDERPGHARFLGSCRRARPLGPGGRP